MMRTLLKRNPFSIALVTTWVWYNKIWRDCSRHVRKNCDLPVNEDEARKGDHGPVVDDGGLVRRPGVGGAVDDPVCLRSRWRRGCGWHAGGKSRRSSWNNSRHAAYSISRCQNGFPAKWEGKGMCRPSSGLWFQILFQDTVAGEQAKKAKPALEPSL